MGDFNSHGKWDTRLPSILPLPTEDEIFDDEYCTAQVMDMRYHIDALEAKVERLEAEKDLILSHCNLKYSGGYFSVALPMGIQREDTYDKKGSQEALSAALEGKQG